ncbi:ribosomal RNA small subunit methyltransferase I [Sphingomonas astaxanthinifaciens DSM 22298]|uniref:Ribosomal RNA small subunit methyltransferase I n=2 Tax=Sphingomonas TaxID=13687 RepID=A0ABQ5Z9T0_9SPHN|nr:16S rRNA (cytidine(1402)-2'-O)-methyltransferase [Sphingomonas astaxanthinifaciens]GLR48380.1 ribosomal RNA small subunit methyltransferase I [Sphingomonas astaxanthinifaciens DSM 22298]
MTLLLPMNETLPPGLYIVATPIGNLGDLSPRAARVLAGASLVLAEDKRVSARLLAHAGASVPMRTYNDHSDEADRAGVVARLGTEAIALVSDAGTPLISDPGYKLVRDARAAGHEIFTIPGPCAAVAALTLAGLPTDRFLFIGFLPPKEKARADALAEIAGVRASLVFYESGPRLGASLASLAAVLGPREAAVARELTKLHEQCVTGTLADLAERYRDSSPKGEIVVVVGPPAAAPPPSEDQLDQALRDLLASGESPSRAAATVSQQFGIKRKLVYDRALQLAR